MRKNNAPDWWEVTHFPSILYSGHIEHFQEKSDPLRPYISFNAFYDDEAIILNYYVHGVSPVAAPREYNDMVCKDSCCEFFVQPPRPFGGYMNFEVNAAGVLHCSHILDPERTPAGFKHFRYVRPEHGAQVQVRRWRGGGEALPPCKEIALDESITTWGVLMRIPFALLRTYIGPWDETGTWRANFFSCQSIPGKTYYASWTPVPVFNFHTPQYFGELQFVKQ